jgi:hypothetical protein
MKKFAAIALSLSLVSTAASAVVIDVTVDGVVNRINCGTQANLAASSLSDVQKGFCQQFFDTAAQAGAGAGGAGAGGAGAGGAGGAAAGGVGGAGGAAAGAFGLGGAGSIALAALGIALVAGFGGSSNTTSGDL